MLNMVDRKTFCEAAKELVWGEPTMMFVDEQGIEFVWPIPHNNRLSWLERENEALSVALRGIGEKALHWEKTFLKTETTASRWSEIKNRAFGALNSSRDSGVDNGNG